MVVSMLRKRRQVSAQASTHKGANAKDTPERPSLSHSLSLPDLTSPLLDPSSWEEVPSFLTQPNLAGLVTSTAGDSTQPQLQAQQQGRESVPRGRKASLIKAATNIPQPVQFHRPFTPWQVVTPPRQGITAMDIPGFRQSHSTTNWSRERESYVTQGSEALGGWRKSRKSKVMGRLNVVVVGGKGCGKTSLLNLLADALRSDSQSSTSNASTALEPTHPPIAPPLPSSVPLPISPSSTSPSIPSTPIKRTQAPEVDSRKRTVFPPAPTTRLCSLVLTIDQPEKYDRTHLRLIDTPGLALGTDTVSEKERQRGVSGLLRMMEDRFAKVMQEESRIVRRTTRGEDDLVHLVLYLIDARTVLRPATEYTIVDWSCVGVFDDAEPDTLREEKTEDIAAHQSDTSARLSKIEVDIIRQLSTRSNILLTLSHADALTTSELAVVRSAVRAEFPSLGKTGLGIFSISTADEDEEEEVSTPSTPELSPSKDGVPSSPDSDSDSASTNGADHNANLPWAIFSPEPQDLSAPTGTEQEYVRQYPWGKADVRDPTQSDFTVLRDTIMGSQAKALRTTTREVLYERYRTERLLAKQERRREG